MSMALKAALAALAAAILLPGAVLAQAQPEFKLGFKALADQIPAIVGQPLENEHHNPINGDSLQQTTRGLMVWRKADNWTAFTDGHRSWVNGPFGLQSRLNSERFEWERDRRTVTVLLFFSRSPDSLDDFAAVFPVQRQVEVADQRVATAALEALIAGPTPAEQAQGYFSELGQMLRGESLCEGRDFRLSIDGDGTATVQLCRQVTSAGIGQDARVQSQIEATLRQFGTVQRVRLLDQQGRCLFDLSGLNRC